MLRISLPRNRQRRGMILIVVLSLLTLFAIVGISFVLISDSMALSAGIASKAEGDWKPDTNPEGTFAMFLGQLVYDVEDTAPGIYSAVRGNSLARTMYGYNNANISLNDKAFSGFGRPRVPSPFVGVAGATPVSQYLGYLVNTTYNPADGFLLDPERTDWRAGPTAAESTNYFPANAPYTYPDHNNFFLGVFDPVGNQVTCPSFHRPWLFGTLDPSNPNWTSRWGKYLTARPRPAEMGPNFPLPEDLGGDVKNMIGAPGGNDSIWIDIGAPVMVSADGRKFKPLFAPLILDMDGRLNLNVHGNIRATNLTHASGQGWGPWEVNLSRVLPANELQQLFLGVPSAGNQRVFGRYGPDGAPGVNNSLAPPGTTPRGWGQVDFDGISNGPGGLDLPGPVSPRFHLPGEAGTLPYQLYPTFSNSWANGSVGERQNHSWLYNPFRQTGSTLNGLVNPARDDRNLSASSLAQLLRQGSTGSQGLTSDLNMLLPTTMNNPALRNLLTTHSTDIDRPGAVPYIWATDPSAPYTWTAANGYPTAVGPTIAAPFNSVTTNRPGAVPPGSEFDANWRSQLAANLRVNLNRPLADYPAPDATGFITNYPAYNAAVADRQLLAQDLFNALVVVTGVPDPGPPNAAVPYFNAANAGYFQARRWLAQLAVNIVDFVDSDDYSTIWMWYNVGGITDTVYGTEQPAVVVNELYAQLDNLATDKGIVNVLPLANRKATDGYALNVWAELLNPRSTETINGTTTSNIATLALNNQAIYQIVLAGYDGLPAPNGITNTGPNALADPANTTGLPTTSTLTNANTTTVVAIAPPTTSTWTTAPTPTTQTVQPDNNAFSSAPTQNQGFYVLGSSTVFLTDPNDPSVQPANPNLPVTYQAPGQAAGSTGMQVQIPVTTNMALFTATVLLRRVAVPTLPPNDPTTPTYNPALPLNPYITVDTFTLTPAQIMTNDARSYIQTGANAGYVAVAARQAYGRMQPLAASPVMAQNPAQPAPAQPRHTFYRHNSLETAPAVNYNNPAQTLRTFNWLAHLDRQVVSPLELLRVSAWPPHQLTNKFFQNGLPSQQSAKWFDPTTRLARFLEFVQTAPRQNGVIPGGRVPGKININTMPWNNPLVFQALADGQDGTIGNRFTDAQVQALYTQLINYRTPAGTTPGTNGPDPTLNGNNPERPFWSLAVGAAPGNDQWTGGTRGLENTLLAPVPGGNATSPRLLDPFGGATQDASGTIHPYQNMGLLNKIYNNVTTRSNVFAVWLTVGYFEVTDDTVRPIKLGAEIGRTEGRNVRHRYFALIDRTKMEGIRFQAGFNAAVNPQPGVTTYAQFPAPGVTRPSLVAPSKTWNMQSGQIITLNPDTDFGETTALISAGGGGFQGVVRQPYQAAPTQQTVVQYGNPGPWTRYDPKKDPCVLYFAVVD